MILSGPYAAAVAERRDELQELLLDASATGEFGEVAVSILRDTGLMEALKPIRYGGHGATPREFFSGVVALAAAFPALGWIAGVLGVHAFEIALSNEQTCEEVWADRSRDNWIASPFIQSGRAVATDGGYLLNGVWDFSSGFDWADWLCIGGRIQGVAEAEAGRNFCLLRSSARAVPRSWKVVGLQGTGSLTFAVEDVFVPDHMVIDPTASIDGQSWKSMMYEEPVYRMPRQTMLSSAITASTLGAGLGLVESVIALTRTRLKGSSKRQASRDPYILRAIAESDADVEAGIHQMMGDLDGVMARVGSGLAVPRAERMRIKRNLVRSVHRTGESLSELFSQCGGGALRLGGLPQLYWREFQAGRNHNSHIYDWYGRYGHELFGLEAQGGVV